MENQQDNPIKTEASRESGWEREVIEKLALAAVTEQTRARRWSVFFKSLMFAYLIAIFGV
ncbi:MAG: protease IV, partial [Methylococcaceae bacterium NSP1-1]